MTAYNVDQDESWPESVDLPDNGDVPDAASVNVGLEAALDGLACLKSRVLTWQMSNAATIFHFGKKVPLFPAHQLSTNWSIVYKATSPTSIPLGWTQSSHPATNPLVFEVEPPHAMAVLASVEVELEGAGYPGCADHGGLPATVPTLQVYRVSDGVLTLVDEASDTSATQAIYDAVHKIALSGLDSGEDPVTLGARWLVAVTPEQSTNAAANKLAIWDVTCHWADSEDVP
jgi:hypothetical protein